MPAVQIEGFEIALRKIKTGAHAAQNPHVLFAAVRKFRMFQKNGKIFKDRIIQTQFQIGKRILQRYDERLPSVDGRHSRKRRLAFKDLMAVIFKIDETVSVFLFDENRTFPKIAAAIVRIFVCHRIETDRAVRGSRKVCRKTAVIVNHEIVESLPLNLFAKI